MARLGPGGEFDRIRQIADALGDAAGALGDDTAAIPSGKGTLVVSTDATVEHQHFERPWISPVDVGFRAAASALSDLAAAGALPAGIVVALTIPLDVSHEYVVDLMRGTAEAARSVDTKVLGGDLSSSDTLSVVVTVFGYAKRRMSRAGAEPGDGIWVTGTLGGARAALRSWLDRETPDAGALQAFARPTPRIAAGAWLAAHGATAMMDISDGLGGDAEHIAAASAVRLEIELERLPMHAAVVAAAANAGMYPEVFAGTGGEDYELLVTLPAKFDGAAKCERETGVRLTRIGTVKSGQGVAFSRAGEAVELEGFKHRL